MEWVIFGLNARHGSNGGRFFFMDDETAYMQLVRANAQGE